MHWFIFSLCWLWQQTKLQD